MSDYYYYSVISKDGPVKHTPHFQSAFEAFVSSDAETIRISNNSSFLKTLYTIDECEAWMAMLERTHWNSEFKAAVNIEGPDKISEAVDPTHYKTYLEDYQWLDAMSRIPTLRDPAKFEAAVELQIRKYLDRNGQKDNSIQELMKARWYLSYLIAYKKAGRPILVSEVEAILAS
jgi:hypothetical protein